MARKKAAAPATKVWNKAKWVGFVDIGLQEQERRAIKESLLDVDGIAQFFQDAAAGGYKLSVSYSIPEDCYTVSMTGQYQEKANGGLTASIRHREFEVAVTALWFVTHQDGYAVNWEDRFGSASGDDW